MRQRIDTKVLGGILTETEKKWKITDKMIADKLSESNDTISEKTIYRLRHGENGDRESWRKITKAVFEITDEIMKLNETGQMMKPHSSRINNSLRNQDLLEVYESDLICFGRMFHDVLESWNIKNNEIVEKLEELVNKNENPREIYAIKNECEKIKEDIEKYNLIVSPDIVKEESTKMTDAECYNEIVERIKLGKQADNQVVKIIIEIVKMVIFEREINQRSKVKNDKKTEFKERVNLLEIYDDMKEMNVINYDDLKEFKNSEHRVDEFLWAYGIDKKLYYLLSCIYDLYILIESDMGVDGIRIYRNRVCIFEIDRLEFEDKMKAKGLTEAIYIKYQTEKEENGVILSIEEFNETANNILNKCYENINSLIDKNKSSIVRNGFHCII